MGIGKTAVQVPMMLLAEPWQGSIPFEPTQAGRALSMYKSALYWVPSAWWKKVTLTSAQEPVENVKEDVLLVTVAALA